MAKPKRIGPYQIIDELGNDELGNPGMSEIYLARNPLTDQIVVIKRLREKDLTSVEFVTRFQREAKILARLENPHIVPIYDFKVSRRGPYIVMRYLPKGTLKSWIYRGPLPIDKVIKIIESLAKALESAHIHDIIHRDLKPSNVLFDEYDNVYLSDFGLAKQLDASRPLTQADLTIGTLLYMSPEQFRDPRSIGPQSDIYSLGIIFYEMLTGKHPYPNTTNLHSITQSITDENIPQLTKDELEQLKLPVECNKILVKSLAKDPNDRYEKISDMARDVIRLSNSASKNNFKQTPIDASHAGRFSYWLTRRLDNKVYGGVADENQFRSLYGWARALPMVVAFLFVTIAGGLIWTWFSTSFSQLNPPLSPTITTIAEAKTMQVQTHLVLPTTTSSSTSTVTITISPTLTGTPTFTATPSLTLTLTESSTSISTRTETPTLTPTITKTLLPTPSLTATKKPKDTAPPSTPPTSTPAPLP